MKDFKLVTSDGETINKVKAYNAANAVRLFARLKNLTTLDLLKIFSVESD